MTIWTQAAKDELERYFQRVRASVAATGADPAEVTDDLRRHLEQEATASGLEVVTEQDARRLLQRIGAPQPDEAARAAAATPTALPGPADAPRPSAPPNPPRKVPSVWLVLGGVVLPGATLAIEGLTGMCAGAFFDPMPTWWHVLLVALVPIVNGWTYSCLARGRLGSGRALGWANGIALAIACFYALRFVPLLLPGLFGLIVMGLGLLPWSPLLAVVSTVYLRRHLRHAAEAAGVGPVPGLWRGLLVGLVALVLADAPVWITRIGLEMAVDEDPVVQRRGIGWLRAVGDDEVLLRECYGRTPSAGNMDLVGWIITGGKRVLPEKARAVYYRVTGQPFNSVPAPNVRTARGRWAELDEWTWDPDQGGEQVGGRLKGLRLLSSRLDAVIEAEAATAYTEWTLEFQNDALGQREARAQLLLPPGGVVSRLTLWIDGEEREAAFAGRSAARAAYQRIAIQQRRDPVLVTTCGSDRVLVQCFPVPPTGGVMKVRLGITSPLLLTTRAEGAYRWPCFIERNFTIPDTLTHAVWAESRTALTPANGTLKAEQPKPDLFAVRGAVTEPDLSRTNAAIRVKRDPDGAAAWAMDPRCEPPALVQSTVTETSLPLPSRVVWVIDGSQPMEPHLGLVTAAIARLPGQIPASVLVASDPVMEFDLGGAAGPRAASEVGERLARVKPGGGQDNVPALVRAWDLAAERPGGVVIWITSPQPVLLQSPEALRQAYERRPNGPVIHVVQTTPGPNRLLEQLDGIPNLRAWPRLSDLRTDLERVVDILSAKARVCEAHFDRVTAGGDSARATGTKASDHMCRLWAAQEVRRLQSIRNPKAGAELAARYQLVTPVSGAVVLETVQQYRDTGLEPADPTTVPAIPEPSTCTLLVLGLALLWLGRRSRG